MDRLVTVAWTPPSAKRRKRMVPGRAVEGAIRKIKGKVSQAKDQESKETVVDLPTNSPLREQNRSRVSGRQR